MQRMISVAALTLLGLVLAGCNKPNELVGTSNCAGILSPVGQSYTNAEDGLPVRCGPQTAGY